MSSSLGRLSAPKSSSSGSSYRPRSQSTNEAIAARPYQHTVNIGSPRQGYQRSDNLRGVASSAPSTPTQISPRNTRNHRSWTRGARLDANDSITSPSRNRSFSSPRNKNPPPQTSSPRSACAPAISSPRHQAPIPCNVSRPDPRPVVQTSSSSSSINSPRGVQSKTSHTTLASTASSSTSSHTCNRQDADDDDFGKVDGAGVV